MPIKKKKAKKEQKPRRPSVPREFFAECLSKSVVSTEFIAGWRHIQVDYDKLLELVQVKYPKTTRDTIIQRAGKIARAAKKARIVTHKRKVSYRAESAIIDGLWAEHHNQ